MEKLSMETKPKIRGDKLTSEEQKQIRDHLRQADSALKQGDKEAALAQWVAVLHIQADHETALPQALDYLKRWNYDDDIVELVWRAVEGGATDASLPPLLLDRLWRSNDSKAIRKGYSRLAKLPNVSDTLLCEITDKVEQG